MATFDAIKRREVYATTGPRITVRVFGGWDFKATDADARDLALVGYARGVPMITQEHTGPSPICYTP